jgi:DNA-binding NarL/FixJ family response regulator
VLYPGDLLLPAYVVFQNARKRMVYVPRVKILVRELPGMLRDIVTRLLAAEDDLEVVGEGDRGDLSSALAQFGADVVVLGCDDPEAPELGQRVLRAHPLLKVLAVATECRQAVLHELRPHRTVLGELTPESLLAAIRSAAGSGLAADGTA